MPENLATWDRNVVTATGSKTTTAVRTVRPRVSTQGSNGSSVHPSRTSGTKATVPPIGYVYLFCSGRNIQVVRGRGGEGGLAPRG